MTFGEGVQLFCVGYNLCLTASYVVNMAAKSEASLFAFHLVYWDGLALLVRKFRKREPVSRSETAARDNAEDLFKSVRRDGLSLEYTLGLCHQWLEGVMSDPWQYGYTDRIYAKKYSSIVRATVSKLYLEEALRRKAQEDAAKQNAFRWSHQPPPRRPDPTPTGWRKVLGLPAGTTDTKLIKLTARRLIMASHPDRGGKGNTHIYIQALDEARKELGFV